MKVSDLKKQLAHMDDDDEIIVAYWERDTFPDVGDDEWDDMVGIVEDNMDWSYTHEQMQDVYNAEKDDDE